MKPHLTRANGYWTCQGQGTTGYGVTPASAYQQWRVMRPDFKAERALSARDAAMLQALREWRPAVAH
jgi:hypothetical protein